MKTIQYTIGVLLLLCVHLNTYAFGINDTILTRINEEPTAVHLKDTLKTHLEFEGDIDFGYIKSFNNPINNIQLYSSNPLHVNQFNLAYAYGQVKYETNKFKAVMALHAGSIVDLMYLSEAQLIKPIREMSIYYKLPKLGFGFEGGILPSIFGAETFINRENQHATRAVMTDFAPDFEVGVRFHYKLNKFFSGKLQMTNGWQVIRENNKTPALGIVNAFENKNVMINWGVFLGNEPYRGSLEQLRMYHNVFAKIKLNKFTLIPLFDIGMQRDTTIAVKYNSWHSFGMSVKYQLNKTFALAGRFERIYDPFQIIPETITNTVNGFQMYGYTGTIEYKPIEHLILRIEGKYSSAKDAIFATNSHIKKSKYDSFVMFSAIIHFSKKNNH